LVDEDSPVLIDVNYGFNELRKPIRISSGGQAHGLAFVIVRLEATELGCRRIEDPERIRKKAL
jgi:hypothetical protein